METLFDMHCHLDFAVDAETCASEAAGRIAAVVSTVTPSSYESAKASLGCFAGVRVALGMHPWWVADGRVGPDGEERFCELAREARVIGEVGLDYHAERRKTRERQIEALARALGAVGEAGGGRLVFLHAVKSYDDVFSLLDRFGTHQDNACVFHWFSGSESDFQRALEDGYAFSVGLRMLSTKKGADFASRIPQDRLLIETDDPPREGATWSAGAWERKILDTAEALATVRGETRRQTLETVAANSERFLRDAFAA